MILFFELKGWITQAHVNDYCTPLVNQIDWLNLSLPSVATSLINSQKVPLIFGIQTHFTFLGVFLLCFLAWFDICTQPYRRDLNLKTRHISDCWKKIFRIPLTTEIKCNNFWSCHVWYLHQKLLFHLSKLLRYHFIGINNVSKSI